MATRIGSAFFDVTFNTAPARRELTALVATANRQFGLLGGIGIVGATLAVAGLVRGTVGLGTAALEAANAYEQAFASVRKTLDTGVLSADQAERVFGKLSDELRALALATPLDLEEELTPVAALGAQMGIAAQDIANFTKVISEIGVTTNIATEDAAIGLARIANIMGIPQEGFRDFGDTLINLGNQFPAREDEILRFATRIAAAGRLAGFTADEVLALATAMTSVGVPAERGGTAIQATFTRISEAVASGNERLDLIAQTAGLSADAFADAWRTRPAEAFNLFVLGLQAAGADAFGILGDMELGGIRATQALLSIAQAGPLLEDTFTQAAGSADALARESEIFFNTTEGRMQLLANAAEDAGLTIGEHLQDPFNELLTISIDWFAQNQELIDQIGENLGGALEGLIPIATQLLDTFGAMVVTVTDVAEGLFTEGITQGIEVPLIFGVDIIPGEDTGKGAGEEFADFLQRGLAFDPHIVRLAAEDFGSGFWQEVAKFGLGPIPDILGLFVDEQLGQLTLVEGELRRALGAGVDPIDAMVAALGDLDARLEPLGGRLTELGFSELLDEVELTDEALKDLLVEFGRTRPLPGFLRVMLDDLLEIDRRRPRGRGAFIDLETGEFVPELFVEGIEDIIGAEEEAAAAAEAFDKALKDLGEAAEANNVSLSTLLDNIDRLAPGLVEAVDEIGRASLETAAFEQALAGLQNALDFDTGAVVDAVNILEGAFEFDTDFNLDDLVNNIEEQLQQLADFEAGISILEVLNLDNLAAEIRSLGPAATHALEHLIEDLPTAIELEATLDLGGTPSKDIKKILETTLEVGDVTPELLGLARGFTSGAVQQAIVDAAGNIPLNESEFQAGLDQLDLSVDVALNFLVPPSLSVPINFAVGPGGGTIPVVVNIESGGTTSGDAARAGQAINNVVNRGNQR